MEIIWNFSVAQRGKIEMHARERMSAPPEQVIDRDGRVGTDADQILKDFAARQHSLAPLGVEEFAMDA